MEYTWVDSVLMVCGDREWGKLNEKKTEDSELSGGGVQLEFAGRGVEWEKEVEVQHISIQIESHTIKEWGGELK